MSFGRRLRLFFVGIVVLPTIVLVVLVLQVGRDSRDGQADARLAAGLDTARAVYDEALLVASEEAKRIATEVGPQLADLDPAVLDAAIDRARTGPRGMAAVSIVGPDGEVLAGSGAPDAIATGRSVLRSSEGGELIGSVRVAALGPAELLDRVAELTARDAALIDREGVLASSTDLGEAELPDAAGTDAVGVELPGGDFRAAALALDGATPGARLVLFTPLESAFTASEPAVAVALAAFFAVALTLLVLLVRDLQRRIAAMLEGARQIGDGNFDHRVSVQGNDEMAGLGRELNRMSDRLRDQMDELRRQRRELDGSVKRIGEAFASGLDRNGLLQVVAETAVSACAAEGGRIVLREGGDAITTPESPEHLEAALARAADGAWDTGREGSASVESCHAIAQAVVDRSEGDRSLCVLSVARRGADFDSDEREVLRYLIGQTSASIENIELHERVSEQALTDELTRIPNNRQFNDWLQREVTRIERFGGELSVILIDIDDFKVVNDTFGHPQGDRVLERIGLVLKQEVRDVDLPARIGGDEFVVGLPETEREGATLLAERLRVAIERSRLAGMDGRRPLRITASLGIGTLPGDGDDARSVTAAADRALYQAKRAGKNRVVARSVEESATRRRLPQVNRRWRRN